MFRMHELTAAVSLFPNKLFHMVNDQQCSSLIWGGDGDHLVINTRRFEDEMLQETAARWKYQLKTTSMTSFIRQLHAYGFRKVIESFDLISIREPNHIRHYYHPYFHRDRPDLLMFMKRSIRSTSSRRHTTGQEQISKHVLNHLQTPIGEPLLRNYVPQHTLNQSSLAFQPPQETPQSPMDTSNISPSNKRKRKTQPKRHPSFQEGNKYQGLSKEERIFAIANDLQNKVKKEKLEEMEGAAFLTDQKPTEVENIDGECSTESCDDISDTCVKDKCGDSKSNSEKEEISLASTDPENDDDSDWADDSLPTMIPRKMHINGGEESEFLSPQKQPSCSTPKSTKEVPKIDEANRKIEEVETKESKVAIERQMVTRSSQKQDMPDKDQLPTKVIAKELPQPSPFNKVVVPVLGPTLPVKFQSTVNSAPQPQINNVTITRPNFSSNYPMAANQVQNVNVPIRLSAPPMQPETMNLSTHQGQGTFNHQFPQPLNARIQIPLFSMLQPAYIAWPTRNMYCAKTKQVIQPSPTIIPLPFKPFQVQQSASGGPVNMPRSAFPVVQPHLFTVKQEPMMTGNMNEQMNSMAPPRFGFPTTN